MNSLETRLRVGLALALVVLMGLFWVIGGQALHSMTESFVESRLEHDAEGLLAGMLIKPGEVEVQWRRVTPVYSQPLSGHYYAIRFDDGHTLRSRSLWDYPFEIPRLAPGERHRTLVSGPSGQRLLLLLNGYRKQGRNFTLGVAEDMTPIYRQKERFVGWFAVLALGGLLGLLLVQHLVVRRSLGRLQRVRDDIRRLEQGQVVELSEDVPTEVLSLVQEFNRLLHLLAQRLELSRNAMGNMAHALKGPLNLLTNYFDASGSDPDDPDKSQAAAQTQRLSQLIERELKRARFAGRDPSGQRFVPAQELPDLVALLRQIHREQDLTVRYHIGEGVVSFGEREDMLELLGNLLDNACKWAQSRVECRIRSADGISIRVEDDGKGLRDEDIRLLTQRGIRLDEAVEGHGLGLAIVGDMVRLYGGTITFSRATGLGGLCVEVRLPLAPGAT
jgi:signal transduction histidine kinase